MDRAQIHVCGVFTLLILLSGFGCKSESVRKTSVSEASQSEADSSAGQKEDTFKIRIASGGGVSGLFEGYTLYADGTVEHWQKWPSQQDSVLWSVKQAPGQVAELQKQLEESGMLKEKTHKTGNMTTTVRYILPDTTFTWSWPMDELNRIPEDLSKWYVQVKQFCEQAEEKAREN
ncbi:hypothetical protein GWO43_22515 [candidate division KSB1 bacterium]|nr:hypothetical protein [candidate division KSB1 bacterium]NIT73599.1 hypothetical protein [candidate division KSB1 bacterium]NIX73279.1 hypothetical protein [candidate division KSB1 bacterium]